MIISRVKIGDIARIIDGDRGSNYPKQEEFSTHGYCLFLNAGNVTIDGFRFAENSFITQEKDALLRKGKLIRGDIVYTTRGTIGNVAYYDSSVPYEHVRINSGMVILQPNLEIVDAEFLYQYLKSKQTREYFLSFKTGSAQPQLPIKNFQTIEIDLPDLPTQHRIASILSAYDDLIENNRRQIKLLEEAAQRLYREWFVELRFPGHDGVKVVDGVPEGWKWSRFSDAADIMSGGTPKTENKSYYGGNIPFYTPKDSDGAYYAMKTITYITEDGLNNCHSPLYPADTIIITARGTVGKTTILGTPMAMNQSCYALKCSNHKKPFYLFFALNEEVRKLKAMANGGVFNTIIVKTFDNIGLFEPGSNLIDCFNNLVEPYMEMIKAKMQQIDRLTMTRDMLLPKLMSGEMEA